MCAEHFRLEYINLVKILLIFVISILLSTYLTQTGNFEMNAMNMAYIYLKIFDRSVIAAYKYKSLDSFDVNLFI